MSIISPSPIVTLTTESLFYLRNFGFRNPGVSRNSICVLSLLYTPRILFLVVFGLSLTAEIRLSVIRFIRVDLPVLGLPIIETVPD